MLSVLYSYFIRPLNWTRLYLLDRFRRGLQKQEAAELKGKSGEGLSHSAKSSLLTRRRFTYMQIARGAWYPAAALALTIFLVAIPGFLIIGSQGIFDPRFTSSPSTMVNLLLRFTIVVAILTSLSSLLLAILLYRRRSTDPMALLTSYVLLAYAVIMSGPVEALEPFVPGIAVVATTILVPLFQPFILLLFAVFPDGSFVPGWTKRAIVVAFLIMPASLLWTTRLTQSVVDFSEPGTAVLLGINIIVFVTILAVVLYAQIYRFHHVSSYLQRQQTKWILYGIGVWFTVQALSGIPWIYTYTLPPDSPYPLWLAIISPIWFISIVAIPVTISIAILRYRLFEIDYLINRSLLYGLLTVLVIAIYVLTVGALGLLFQTQGNILITLLATGLVAVLFQPLREKLQAGVNRLVYGERDDPIEALARLGRMLEDALPADQVMSTLVVAIAQTLKLPYAAIYLTGEDGMRLAAASGEQAAELVRFPLVYQGLRIGELEVAVRQRGSMFTAAETRLLRNIARQAGTAIHAARLALDLQQSRQQLVINLEEERLRMRRDLHDGLGPALAAVVWQTDSAKDMVLSNPDEAIRLLGASVTQVQEALSDIRRLVYGLRPPALDEFGLVGALKQAARKYPSTTITIDAPALPELPAAIEVVAYRIAQEAIKNAVTHGQARNCWLFLASDAAFTLRIEDDGIGLPETITPGVGLISMRERAAELGGAFSIQPRQGGGTEVVVVIPQEQGWR